MGVGFGSGGIPAIGGLGSKEELDLVEGPEVDGSPRRPAPLDIVSNTSTMASPSFNRLPATSVSREAPSGTSSVICSIPLKITAVGS